MVKRRLFIFLDGTWNDEFRGDRDSNVVRLRDIVAESIPRLPIYPDTIDWVKKLNDKQTEFGGIRSKDYEYVIFYERGVGTGPGIDRVLGGLTGRGLELNIRRAYRFLCAKYREGDEIFIYGFSRGAFTARSLVGLIGSSGLLKEEYCVAEQEEKAWHFYRQRPNDRLSGDRVFLDKYVHPRNNTRISCLAVFDTVGALGVPLTLLNLVNRARYEFHDVELSPIVDLNLHALAIDEGRAEFPAAVWRRNKYKSVNTIVEQVWFPGVHSDIGGGYYNESDRDDLTVGGIDDITLDWMTKRLKHYFPDFPVAEHVFNEFLPKSELSVQHDSRTLKFKLRPRAVRSIGNLAPVVRWREKVVSRDRGHSVIGESVHISAIERLGRLVTDGAKKKLYAPLNLITCFENLYSHYVYARDGVWSKGSLSIVDWNGDVVRTQILDVAVGESAEDSPDFINDAVVVALREARKRLIECRLIPA